jgi:hypothetical protein
MLTLASTLEDNAPSSLSPPPPTHTLTLDALLPLLGITLELLRDVLGAQGLIEQSHDSMLRWLWLTTHNDTCTQMCRGRWNNNTSRIQHLIRGLVAAGFSVQLSFQLDKDHSVRLSLDGVEITHEADFQVHPSERVCARLSACVCHAVV